MAAFGAQRRVDLQACRQAGSGGLAQPSSTAIGPRRWAWPTILHQHHAPCCAAAGLGRPDILWVSAAGRPQHAARPGVLAPRAPGASRQRAAITGAIVGLFGWSGGLGVLCDTQSFGVPGTPESHRHTQSRYTSTWYSSTRAPRVPSWLSFRRRTHRACPIRSASALRGTRSSAPRV